MMRQQGNAIFRAGAALGQDFLLRQLFTAVVPSLCATWDSVLHHFAYLAK